MATRSWSGFSPWAKLDIQAGALDAALSVGVDGSGVDSAGDAVLIRAWWRRRGARRLLPLSPVCAGCLHR